MDRLAPLGDVYQAGTLSGNPISVAAGLATLRYLRDHDPYPALDRRAGQFVAALADRLARGGTTVHIPRVGSMFSLFFTSAPVGDFEEASGTDAGMFREVFRGALDNGVYLPPSPMEACFISTAHDDAVLDRAAEAFGPDPA
jgi:glutamate-1-semialdehyde 2,1-aminomutase